ncbi:MAG: PQQ-binding-like beta-propeller repeat protein, partial [Planctomycetota bacterium]
AGGRGVHAPSEGLRHGQATDAPPPGPERGPLAVGAEPRTLDFEDAEGTKLLVLKRRGRRGRHPRLLFLGGRTRKRLDNKFVLICVDLEEGEVLWRGRERRGDRWFEEIRLKGKGAEPGFSEAFVCGDLVVVHGLYDVLAFGVGDGRLRWRYRAPFDFEIKHARMSGELLVLAGKTETIALYIPSETRAGEVAWRQKEQGDLYIAPYFQGDRLISVRKLPFSVTARYRLTGKLIGRLALPALSLHPRHPLFEETDPLHRQALPVARDGDLLVVTDGWYYIAVDTRTLTVRWKRLIDNNDVTREPAMRFELGGDYLAILKNDYDQDAIYMLSSRTGRVLWHTDPKDAHSPQPLYSLYVDAPPDGRRQAVLYGFGKHPGQGFYVVGRDCRTGTRLFKQEHAGYDGRPKAWLMRRGFGPERGGAAHLVARVQDRQEFELKALDASTGAAVRTLHREGIGPFGVHGRVSATVQNGRLVLLAKGRLNL